MQGFDKQEAEMTRRDSPTCEVSCSLCKEPYTTDSMRHYLRCVVLFNDAAIFESEYSSK